MAEDETSASEPAPTPLPVSQVRVVDQPLPARARPRVAVGYFISGSVGVALAIGFLVVLAFPYGSYWPALFAPEPVPLYLLLAAILLISARYLAVGMQKLGRPLRLSSLLRRRPEPDAADLDAIHLDLNYTIEKSDYVSASLLTRRNERWLSGVCFLLPMTAGFIEACRVDDNEASLVLFALAGMLMLQVVNLFWGVHKVISELWDNNPGFRRSFRVIINSETITWRVGGIEVTHTWNAFDRFSETRKLIAFGRGAEIPLTIPKRAFDRDQLLLFRRLISNRIRPLRPQANLGGFIVERDKTEPQIQDAT